VLGQHAPRFGFLSMLLGDLPALPAHASFYQRLLAADEREAQAVAVAHARAHGNAAACDDVLLPALKRIRKDRERDGVEPKDEAFVFDATARALATLDAVPPSAAADTMSLERKPLPQVLAVPAHHRSEEVALAMIAKLCVPDIAHVEVTSSRTLASDVGARIGRDHPALVVIGVVPPGGLTQTVFLCRRLAHDYPELPIVVAYLRQPKDFDALLVRLKKAGASYVTTSLTQTVSRIEALLRSKTGVS